jgi:glycosyltransferase involved in cell wall biosynthesis
MSPFADLSPVRHTADETLRILHIAESFGAGVLSMLVTIANYQASQGHEVHVAHSVREETPDEYADLFDRSIQLHSVPMTRKINPRADLRALRRLTGLMGTIQPSLVHLHSSKAGFLGRAAARIARVPAFYSPHGISFLRKDISRTQKLVYLLLEWLGAKIGGCIVACSSSEYQGIQHQLAPRELTLVENGIELPHTVSRSRSSGPLTIGMAGRISPEKNPLAFARLAQQLNEEKLVWVGDGLVAEREQLENASVSVTGWLDRAAATKLIGGLDVYVHTSLAEGMPLTVLEAMSAGVPVVALNNLGTRDVVIHGETGYLANTEEELLTFVQVLAARPELRERMSRNARRVAIERYSSTRMNRELLALYEGVLAVDYAGVGG